MNEGDIALTPLPQANGLTKSRPVLLLRKMAPFGDWLVCGVSSQLRQEVLGFDEVIEPADPDFVISGLKIASVIRLGFLAVIPEQRLLGRLGEIAHARSQRLRLRLSNFLK
jgi:mRNA interferase MazF